MRKHRIVELERENRSCCERRLELAILPLLQSPRQRALEKTGPDPAPRTAPPRATSCALTEQYRDLAPAPRRGRRRKTLTTLQRTALRVLHERHPLWGLAKLRQVIPGLPRNSDCGLPQASAKRVRGKGVGDGCCASSRWLVLGAVWAIDGTWLDRPCRRSGAGRWS
jgi:hypothetical protein